MREQGAENKANKKPQGPNRLEGDLWQVAIPGVLLLEQHNSCALLLYESLSAASNGDFRLQAIQKIKNLEMQFFTNFELFQKMRFRH